MRLFAVSGLVALAAVLAVPAAASAAAVPAAGTVPSVAAASLAIAPAAAAPAVATAPAAIARSGLPEARKPTGDLLDVSCVTDKDCVAVGANMTSYRPLVETWNGKGWKAVSLPMPAGENGATLDWVSCPTKKSLSGTLCVATGNEGNVPFYVGSYTAYGVSAFWNGKSWHLVPFA
jgi:hypothetical protein